MDAAECSTPHSRQRAAGSGTRRHRSALPHPSHDHRRHDRDHRSKADLQGQRSCYGPEAAHLPRGRAADPFPSRALASGLEQAASWAGAMPGAGVAAGPRPRPSAAVSVERSERPSAAVSVERSERRSAASWAPASAVRSAAGRAAPSVWRQEARWTPVPWAGPWAGSTASLWALLAGSGWRSREPSMARWPHWSAKVGPTMTEQARGWPMLVARRALRRHLAAYSATPSGQGSTRPRCWGFGRVPRMLPHAAGVPRHPGRMRPKQAPDSRRQARGPGGRADLRSRRYEHSWREV